MLRPGFGFVWRLIMFTPSTIRRFLSGSTFRIRPFLPRSLPVITSTLSFFRSGVATLGISTARGTQSTRSAQRTIVLCGLAALACSLQHLRCERNDLHEPALTQLARDRSEHARADRLPLVVDQHRRVAIEADVAAV